MEIRQKPIPAPTKYNAEEICAIREAKAFYALQKGEQDENFDQGLKRPCKYFTGKGGKVRAVWL